MTWREVRRAILLAYGVGVIIGFGAAVLVVNLVN